MKKWMAMMLAVVVLAAMAACSSGNDEDGGVPAPQSPQRQLQDEDNGPAEDDSKRESEAGTDEAMLTIGGVTYGLGDKVEKLFDNGWYIEDEFFPDYRGAEMTLKDFQNRHPQFDLVHDDVNVQMNVSLNTRDVPEDTSVGDVTIGHISLWPSSGEVSWDISGMINNTDTLDSILQALPGAISEEEQGVHVRISLNNYFNLSDNGSSASALWNLADEYFYFVEVSFMQSAAERRS